MKAANTPRPPGHRLVVDWQNPTVSAPYSHKYGETPSSGAVLPLCRCCGKNMHLLLQADLTDPSFRYLGLKSLGYLFVLTCMNCLSYLSPMYYRVEYRGSKIVVLREQPVRCIDNYPHPLDEHPVSCRGLVKDDYPLTEDDLSRLISREGKHQLGGTPIWIQDEEHISCVACGTEMEYIAIVDSELYVGEDGFPTHGHMFGDEGILYTFMCRRCGILATKTQSL